MFPLGACKARMLEASKLRSSPDMGQNGMRIMERSEGCSQSCVFLFTLYYFFLCGYFEGLRAHERQAHIGIATSELK